MFCTLYKKKIYPAYISKHNSDHEKQVIPLIILNGREPEANLKDDCLILQQKNISIIKRRNSLKK